MESVIVKLLRTQQRSCQRGLADSLCTETIKVEVSCQFFWRVMRVVLHKVLFVLITRIYVTENALNLGRGMESGAQSV